MKHLLADAINRMPDRERLVLTLYYYEGLTLAEIGDILGVTESRVCQIHTKAILQLRAVRARPEPVHYAHGSRRALETATLCRWCGASHRA